MKIGVLCSGGDSPGMNAAIRGAVLRGTEVHGFEMVGFIDGWRGFHEHECVELNRQAVRGLSPRGGVFIGTSRWSPFPTKNGTEEEFAGLRSKMADYGLDGMILIGGDGTQRVAGLLAGAGFNVLGLPKTIDNDLAGTDYTFGFDTAVGIATEAIDRLRTTGESHNRCMVLEVMGRDAGWIALHAGIAGGAHVMLIPEQPESLDQVCEWVTHVADRDRSALVVVAEGFDFAGEEPAELRGGAHGIGDQLAQRIEACTGIETRATVLGHLQRGGSPSAFDRVLATRTGIAGADEIARGEWGNLMALRGDEIVAVPIMEIAGKLKRVPEERYAAVRTNFG